MFSRIFRPRGLSFPTQHCRNLAKYAAAQDSGNQSRSAKGIVILGGVAAAYVFIQMYHGDSRSSFYRSILMPLLHTLDPETSHWISIKAAAAGLAPIDRSPEDPILKTNVWGKEFANPVGLAAGYDKHGEAMDALFQMGFGFVEVGSVTPLPQPGNPRPRMFRLMEEQAVINRYGFNSDGVNMVDSRLSQWKRKQEIGSLFVSSKKGILGINLGKNKEQTDAAADYVTGLRKLGKHADYIVINVSSPNTPGLRSLQGEKELSELIEKVIKAREEMDWKGPKPPLLVKIAPDLTDLDKEQIARVLLTHKVDGLIVSNTTVGREGLVSKEKNEVGGLSGKPLMEKSTQVLADMYRLTKGKIPIIGVGGISSGHDAYRKIRNGASLVQIYTALGFQGPGIVPAIKEELSELLRKDGFKSISEAVGVDVKLD